MDEGPTDFLKVFYKIIDWFAQLCRNLLKANFAKVFLKVERVLLKLLLVNLIRHDMMLSLIREKNYI